MPDDLDRTERGRGVRRTVEHSSVPAPHSPRRLLSPVPAPAENACAYFTGQSPSVT